MGVDTGITAGVACLSLKGKLLLADHKKNSDLDWIVGSASRAGTPVIVATDKRIAGASVRKVGAAFSTRVFMPSADLTIDEKKRAATREGLMNPHERDAYAAALKAYNAYANKLNQAARLAAERRADADTVMAKVIMKHSIDEAINDRKSGRK